MSIPPSLTPSFAEQVWQAATSSNNEQEAVKNVNQIFETEIDKKLEPLNSQIRTHNNEIENLTTKINKLSNEISKLSLTKTAATEALALTKTTIYFDPNSSELKKEGMEKVRNAADWLNQNSSGKILLKGYADRWSTESCREKTAKGRANAILKGILDQCPHGDIQSIGARIIIITPQNKRTFKQRYDYYKPPRGQEGFGIEAGNRNRRVAIKYVVE